MRRRLLGPVLPALLRQRRRLVLAALAIAVGVGYLAGALGLLNRIRSGLEDLATASADRADLVIEGGVAYESQLEQVRRLVPAGLADTALEVGGVATASHRIEDVAALVDADGRPVVPLGLTEQPLAVNWPEDPTVAPFTFLRGGPPTGESEVAIDARSAEKADVGVGDSITVAGKGAVAQHTVVGIVDPAEVDLPEGSSLAVLSTEAARTVFDRPVDDNRVAIVVDDGADPAEVAAALRAVVPSDMEVVTGAESAGHQRESLTRSFTLIKALVSAFGVLALLVGMSTVANSLALLHTERRHLYASFRLAGARRAQLRRAAMAEAALLATVSSVVGIPLGVLFALLIERAFGSLGTAVPTSGPVLNWQVAAWAAGLGVLATVLAAWRPVSRACNVAPVEAVAPEPPRSSAHGWPRALVVLSNAVVMAAAAIGVGLLASWEMSTVATVGAGAALAVLVAGTVPWVLARLVATAVAVAPFRPRPLRRIAARDAMRSPRRTAFTTMAVLVSVAIVSGLAVFLASFTRSLDEQVGGLVSADLLVDSGTFTRGGLPGDLVERLDEVEGVEAVSGWQLGRGTVGDRAVRLTGLDGTTARAVVSPRWVGPPPAGLDDTSVWVSEDLAGRTGLGPGATAMVTFHSGGTEMLRVTGVYSSGATLLGDMVTDRQVLLRQVPATVDLAALVVTDGSAAATAAVGEVAADYGVRNVLSPDEFIDARSALLRGFERVILWMLLFTLAQALIGLVNTLVMSVGERRREIGLLRVAGSSRAQVLRMVLFEAAAIALVGTAVGLVVGVGGARLAVAATSSFGLGSFAVPVSTLIAVAVGAVGVGVAAAVIPAAMASRVPPLEAIVDTGVEFAAPRRPVRIPAERVTPVAAPAGAPAPAPAWSEPVPAPAPVSAPAPVAARVEVALPTWAAPLPPASVAPAASAAPPIVPAASAAPPIVPAASAFGPPAARPAIGFETVALGDHDLAAALAELYGAPASAEELAHPELAAMRSLLDAPGSPVPLSASEPEAVPAVAPFAAAPTTGAPVVASPVAASPVAAEPQPTEPVPVGPAVLAGGDAEPPVRPRRVVAPFGVQPTTAPAREPAAWEPTAPSAPSAPAPLLPPSAPEPPVPEPSVPAAAATEPAVPPPGEPPPAFEAAFPEVPEAPGPVELPPVVAVPIVPVGEGGADVAPPPEEAEYGDDGAGSRRDRIRRRSSVRFPRRKSRKEPAPSSAADGWVVGGTDTPAPAAASAAGAGPSTGPEQSPAASEPLDPAAAARVTDETLAAAIRRLDPTTVLAAAGSLTRAGQALAPGEWVSAIVCGRVRDWPASVVRTDRRLLLVVDRPERTMVVSMHPIATGVSLQAEAGTGRCSVVLVDRGRRLEVREVGDPAAAEALLRREELIH